MTYVLPNLTERGTEILELLPRFVLKADQPRAGV